MKSGRIIFGFLAFGGVAAIALAALILLRTLALAAFGERAEGIVIDNVRTDIDSAPQAVVRFEAQGRTVEFTNPVGFRVETVSWASRDLHEINDRVTVCYWPSDPRSAVIKGFADFYLRPIILSAFGLVFLAIGGGFLWGPEWFGRRRQRIIAEGVPVQAKVTAVRLERSLEVNDQSPWVIEAQFTDSITGKTVKCTSHYQWTDPTLLHPVGSEVTVFHLQDRLDKYAFLLEETPETEKPG
jgi:Protein of unknown function (DUF3592)